MTISACPLHNAKKKIDFVYLNLGTRIITEISLSLHSWIHLKELYQMYEISRAATQNGRKEYY